MNRKSKIILFIVVVISIGVIAGWLIINKPEINVEHATPTTKITAIELYNNFLKDSAAAKTKYTNNIIEVAGEVTQLNKNQQSQDIILLKTSLQNASVNCTMEGNAGFIKPGDKINIKGICNGYNSGDEDMGIPGDVLLVRCYQIN